VDKKRLPEFWTPWTCTYPVPFLLKIFIPVISLFIFCTISCTDSREQPTTKLYELKGQALGTTWTIKALSQDELDEKELRLDIVRRLEELEKIFSHWRPDAELHQLNSALTTSPFSIHPELLELLRHSKWMHRESGGAFDPTIAPVVNLWGFGPVGKTRSTIPPDDQIEQAMTQTGLDKIEILSKGMVRKKVPTIQLDFSASAKGEIIDQICKLLEHWGLNNYLVEIGGEIRAWGKGRKGKGWVVGLEDGHSNNENGMTSVPLRNYAVATSGSYRLTKPNPDSNRNATHLIDPRTGRPIEHDLIAVNAFAPTARDADAWATALMILGPEEGIKMAEKMDMVARFCVLKDDGFLILKSTAYDRIFTKLTPN
jgi:thiamine biosynthesis lipoprotein